jgi:O-antigen/teichoic acid export membrane protein
VVLAVLVIVASGVAFIFARRFVTIKHWKYLGFPEWFQIEKTSRFNEIIQNSLNLMFVELLWI